MVNSISASANISAAEIKTSNLTIFELVGCKTFLLGPDGIVDNDKQIISTTGTVVVTLNIDVKACKENCYLAEDNTFKMLARLKDANDSGILNFVVGCTYLMSSSTATSNAEATTTAAEYNLSFILDPSSSTICIVITYAFSGDMSPFYSESEPSLTFEAEALKQ